MFIMNVCVCLCVSLGYSRSGGVWGNEGAVHALRRRLLNGVCTQRPGQVMASACVWICVRGMLSLTLAVCLPAKEEVWLEVTVSSSYLDRYRKWPSGYLHNQMNSIATQLVLCTCSAQTQQITVKRQTFAAFEDIRLSRFCEVCVNTCCAVVWNFSYCCSWFRLRQLWIIWPCRNDSSVST